MAKGVASCRTDEQLLARIVSDLLDNSAKHTKKGRITIRTAADEGELTLTIQATGIAIDKEELVLVFDEFYRGQ